MSLAGAERTQVNPAELAGFTRQLGAMLDAGVDVLRALRIAGQHSGNNRLIEAGRDIAARMGDGREFHQAIQHHPDVFDPLYVEMARQGETDGLLGKALLSVADYLDRVAQRPGAVGEIQASSEASGPSTGVTAMAVLGIQAVGAAVIWSVATAQPEILPIQWMGPIAALWVGVCLLSGSWVLHRLRASQRSEAVPRPAPLPPKSRERKSAEAEAVVRNALLEQHESREAPLANVRRLSVDVPSARPNGNGHANGHTGDSRPPWDPNLPDPDSEPPRFTL